MQLFDHSFSSIDEIHRTVANAVNDDISAPLPYARHLLTGDCANLINRKIYLNGNSIFVVTF